MISKVILAKLSPTMETGMIVAWRKQEGETVRVGDILAEIETDKANMEMEALADGVLRKILVPAGNQAPVGGLIGVIAAPDEDISSVLAVTPTDDDDKPRPPSGLRVAAPTPPAIAPPPAPVGRIKASPLARRLAADRHIPLESLAGTGPGGRIVRRDVEAYSVAARPPSRIAAATSQPTTRELALSSMRRTIARRMSESFFTAPHYYVSAEIDMDAASGARKQLSRGENLKVTYNDLLIRACAVALRDFPLVNASWSEDRIFTHDEVHVAFAVTIPDGLITPVVRNADRKSVLEISSEAKDLIARARDKKLRPDEYTGSTFTISNLGMFDVTDFTAIINPPESAILAVGAVRRVPVVTDGDIRVGTRMTVTLGADHRVVDGATAARYLQRVRRLLENPISLFVLRA